MPAPLVWAWTNTFRQLSVFGALWAVCAAGAASTEKESCASKSFVSSSARGAPAKRRQPQRMYYACMHICFAIYRLRHKYAFEQKKWIELKSVGTRSIGICYEDFCAVGKLKPVASQRRKMHRNGSNLFALYWFKFDLVLCVRSTLYTIAGCNPWYSWWSRNWTEITANAKYKTQHRSEYI